MAFPGSYREWENGLHAMSGSQLTFLPLCALPSKAFVHWIKIYWLCTCLGTETGCKC